MADTAMHSLSETGQANAGALRRQARFKRVSDDWATAWQASTVTRSVAVLALIGLVAATVLHSDVMPAATVGVAVLIPAALVDIAERRLPNHMVATAALAIALTIVASTSGLVSKLADGWSSDLAIGAGFMAGPLLVLHLVSPASMGFGDVKASLVLGASLGLTNPQLSLVALLIASGGTAVVGLTTRKRHLAFGPGLILGTVVALLASPVVTATTAGTAQSQSLPLQSAHTEVMP